MSVSLQKKKTFYFNEMHVEDYIKNYSQLKSWDFIDFINLTYDLCFC